MYDAIAYKEILTTNSIIVLAILEPYIPDTLWLNTKMSTPSTSTAWKYSYSSGNSIFDALIYGTQWTSNTITFSFPTIDSVFALGYLENNSYLDFLGSSDRTAVRSALQSWANVATLTFVETTDTYYNVGDLRFAYSYTSAYVSAQAWVANFPGPFPQSGDVWFNTLGSSNSNPWTQGSYYFLAAIHEIGHALGLKHPFNSSPNNLLTLPTNLDSRSFTVMSYSAVAGDNTTHFSYEPTTPMILDISAIQSMYGVNANFNSTNTTYTFSEEVSYHQTIWDVSGNDTIVYNSSSGGMISLIAGVTGGSNLGNTVYAQNIYGQNRFAVKSIWIANNVVIENATGGNGDDIIYGNDVANTLLGNLGNDFISGGAGNDNVDGGSGYNTSAYSGSSSNYTLSVSNAGTMVQDRGGADGIDNLVSIQNLQFSDTSLQNSWFNGALKLATSNPSQFKMMTQMYLAYFNRAPDAIGLDFWAAASYEGSSNIQISNTFASTPEFIRTYGSISSQSSSLALSNFVTAVYENALDRPAEQAGLNFWLNGLLTNQVTPGNLILSIIEAVNAQTGTTDSIYFSNKTSAATHYAVTDGLTNTTQAKAVMNIFNSTYQASGITTAVTAANTLSDQYLADVATTPQLVVHLDLVGLIGLV